ncbi:MAG: AAA family ATPase, partial [Cyanobacteria bacterium HKST-UBA05]|nr:AAA family ATPase [Cyanobacteria bacterium HKST-UBA05]
MSNLLDLIADKNRTVPLPERMRPKTLDEVVGQAHVLGENGPLRQIIASQALTSILFWTPPGVGKTTRARLVAETKSARFVQLSAVSSGVADLRKVVAEANSFLASSGQATVLFIDEIHRYSKTQQDALLPHVENGTVILV